MFEIVEIAPTHCRITDGIIGSHIVSRSHAYLTAALAHKLAAIRAEQHYNAFGDNSFVVVRAGGSPWRHQDIVPSRFDDICF